MNAEVQLLSENVKPLLDQIAEKRSIKFSPKQSEYMERVYRDDETASYNFDSFVTVGTDWANCGGCVLTTPAQLEETYRLKSSREVDLLENRVLLFAIDGDGSFFGYGLITRQIYHFDFGPWVEGDLPWNRCTSDIWDTLGFCEYFKNEFNQNGAV